MGNAHTSGAVGSSGPQVLAHPAVLAIFINWIGLLNDHIAIQIKQVLSIRLDLKYFPTWSLTLDLGTATWRRNIISAV